MDQAERFLGCLLGMAVGDAVGTKVEFRARGTFPPVTDMVGGGPFGLEPGQFTDDTSMGLALGYSLVERGGFDPRDQMERYVDWMRNGTYSSNGVCFDIGNTVSSALYRFLESGEPYSGSTDPYAAGNGSIMRLAPVPMFYAADFAEGVYYAEESSRTTHGAAECVQACKLFAAMLLKALAGGSKAEILTQSAYLPETAKIKAIAQGTYREKSRADIRGSGYVVDSLEAALWCFWQAASYEEAILLAVNLGDDADTTAAVCGQVAGAHYGRSGIPAGWLTKLAMREEIAALALRLMAGGEND